MSINNQWNFKIDISDENSFEKLSDMIGCAIPSELRDFILKNNAASPTDNHIMIKNTERIFESVLSFNENESEAVSVFDMIDKNNSVTVIPFGMDPFGNLFVYSLINNNIVFVEHEEKRYYHTDMSLNEFINCLY